MDWKQIIADIQKVGALTQPQIAAKVGCGQATISDLALGKSSQPRYELGRDLLALLASVKRANKVTEHTA